MDRPVAVSDLFRLILAPEKRFYQLVLVYGVAISALTLSVPLSVQVLISTVVNAGLTRQVFVLALVLFLLLLLSGLFVAIQVYVMELFERKFFSRTLSEVTLRLLYARYAHMENVNRDELVNRYFDIMSVQKSLPPLLTGGLATLLQTVVGITVTSFYHPVLFLFNVALVLSAYLAFRIFHRGAANTAIELSTTKYEAAKWLETVARSNSFFKAKRSIDFAIKQTGSVRNDYMHAHRRHFHYTFAQIVASLMLYALSSALLLGVGGWLVIQGQLTIGQLVAAELILSVILAGFSRFGYYLELYYDLYAAIVKLSQLQTLPHEDVTGGVNIEYWKPSVRFDAVEYELHGGRFRLDFEMKPGETAFIETRSSSQIKAFTNVLLRFDTPTSGQIGLGGYSVDDFAVHQLRDQVHVIDSTLFPECTIAEYLDIAAPGVSRARMRRILEIVGLAAEIPALPNNIEERLTPYGTPLSVSGIIKLKIAYAMLSHPQILVLTPLFDTLSREARTTIFEHLHADQQTTVICFSHRYDLAGFDSYWYWDFTEQHAYTSLRALENAHDLNRHATRRSPATEIMTPEAR